MSDADLLRTAQEMRAGILDGRESTRMCFAVSAAIGGYLMFADLDCELVNGTIEGWDHWWIDLLDGRILDATADQFPNLGGSTPMPEVYLGPKPAWYEVERTCPEHQR